MAEASDADRLAGIEARLGAVEDRLCIYNLMALYGPAVDSDSRAIASAIWAEDGEYNVNVGGAWLKDGGHDLGEAVWQGHEAIEGMIAGPSHQSRIAAGCAHQVSAPYVVIDGDTAVATCYQTLIMHRDGAFVIDRQTANRWEFARTADGWRVTRRTNRLLNGDGQGKALLAAGLAG